MYVHMYEIGMYACIYTYNQIKIRIIYIHTHVKRMYIHIRLRKCVNVKLGEATKRNVWKKHNAKYINMYMRAFKHIYCSVSVY